MGALDQQDAQQQGSKPTQDGEAAGVDLPPEETSTNISQLIEFDLASGGGGAGRSGPGGEEVEQKNPADASWPPGRREEEQGDILSLKYK